LTLRAENLLNISIFLLSSVNDYRAILLPRYLALKERTIAEWKMYLNDTLPRIHCNMSKEEFFKNYVDKREPVMITGCLQEWPKYVREWTLEKILRTFNNHSWLTYAIPMYGQHHLMAPFIELLCVVFSGIQK
jgi:hypothetical protein